MSELVTDFLWKNTVSLLLQVFFCSSSPERSQMLSLCKWCSCMKAHQVTILDYPLFSFHSNRIPMPNVVHTFSVFQSISTAYLGVRAQKIIICPCSQKNGSTWCPDLVVGISRTEGDILQCQEFPVACPPGQHVRSGLRGTNSFLTDWAVSCYVRFSCPQITCYTQPSYLETATALQAPRLNFWGACLAASGVVCFIPSFPSKMKNVCLLTDCELM